MNEGGAAGGGPVEGLQSPAHSSAVCWPSGGTKAYCAGAILNDCGAAGGGPRVGCRALSALVLFVD